MKRELEQKARELVKTAPAEAVTLYKEIWDTYSEEFNHWDALFTIQALRNAHSLDLEWANEMAIKFEDEKVRNVYAWLVFDKCIRDKDRQSTLNNESDILKMVEIITQKNLREDSSYPCPVTILVFKLCDSYAENLFNARRINELLSLLDYNLLSITPRTLDTEARGEVELASGFEKYFALKTKAEFKINEFETCIESCNTALKTLNQFHYNNDLWFKMRIALSEDKLGNHEKSELLLEELLKSKAGNDKWFLYRDVAEIYFEQKNFDKAWKFAVDAAFHGNEPHYLIGLYFLQVKILYKLNRSDEGKLLAELIAAILKENNWGYKQEYTQLFNFYKIDASNIDTLKKMHSKLQEFWNKERYGNIERSIGSVISIHKNGKIGRIKMTEGIIVDFHKKNLQKNIRNLEELKGNFVEFYLIKSIDGKLNAESISYQIKPKTFSTAPNEIIKGKVKAVKDFGVFVSLGKEKDGLLHKNSLKGIDLNSFEVGQEINVKIDKVTDKGINLKLS